MSASTCERPRGHVAYWETFAIAILVGLSVVLLQVVGAVGEGVLNVWRSSLPEWNDLAETLPLPARFVYSSFPLNSGHFLFSMTPPSLFFVFAGLVILRCARKNALVVFLCVFLGAWLVTLCYLGICLVGLLAPFHLLMVELRPATPLFTIPVYVTAWTLAILIVGCMIWRVREWQRERNKP